MHSQKALPHAVDGMCTKESSTESHSWLCRYCLGLFSYLQMGCGYLFPGLLHSKALKAVSGGPSAAAAAPRRSLARGDGEVRRLQKPQPGPPVPERGASSRPERPREHRARSPDLPPRPPASAPDSRRLSRSRGGAADASRRLPAFSISPFTP